MIKESCLLTVVGQWAASLQSFPLLVRCHILKGTLELKVLPIYFQLLFVHQTERL